MRKSWWPTAVLGGDDGSTTTNVQNQEPWAGQQPFLRRGFQEAERSVLQRPLQFYPQSTVVPFSQESEVGLGAQTDRALSGSPLLSSAQGYTQGLLDDPGSGPVFDAVTSEVKPGVDSAFSRGGRLGSGLHTEALSKGVSRGMAPYMEAAANRAPQLAREDYFDIGQLRDVGTARETKSQENLQDSISRFNFAQSEPANRLAQYTGLIRGNYGGTSTSTTRASQSVNPFLTGAGLAASGAQLAGNYYGAGGAGSDK